MSYQRHPDGPDRHQRRAGLGQRKCFAQNKKGIRPFEVVVRDSARSVDTRRSTIAASPRAAAANTSIVQPASISSRTTLSRPSIAARAIAETPAAVALSGSAPRASRRSEPSTVPPQTAATANAFAPAIENRTARPFSVNSPGILVESRLNRSNLPRRNVVEKFGDHHDRGIECRMCREPIRTQDLFLSLIFCGQAAEPTLESAPGVMEPFLDGADGNVEKSGDLLVREVAQVLQRNRFSRVLRKGRNCLEEGQTKVSEMRFIDTWLCRRREGVQRNRNDPFPTNQATAFGSNDRSKPGTEGCPVPQGASMEPGGQKSGLSRVFCHRPIPNQSIGVHQMPHLGSASRAGRTRLAWLIPRHRGRAVLPQPSSALQPVHAHKSQKPTSGLPPPPSKF